MVSSVEERKGIEMNYETPTIDIMEWEIKDIVCTSGGIESGTNDGGWM